jgi:hypothetical protein
MSDERIMLRQGMRNYRKGDISKVTNFCNMLRFEVDDNSRYFG